MRMLSHENKTKRLVEDFKSVVQNAEDLLKATSNEGNDIISELREKVEKSVSHAKDGLTDIQELLLGTSKKTAKMTNEYVHQYPWVSIGSAVAIGVVMGMLLASRK